MIRVLVNFASLVVILAGLTYVTAMLCTAGGC